MSESPRVAALRRALGERILVLDGATGTALADLGLWAADYGGEELLGCHEALLLHRPDVILGLHRGYAAAGADILKTDSFGGTPVVLAEYGLADHTLEINTMAAALARRIAVEAEARDGRPRWVAGSIGPTTRSLTLTGGATFSEMVAAYRLQVEGLAQGGADVLLVETVQDALNLKAALIACREAAPHVPVAVSATMEPTGTTLGGQTIEAIAAIAAPWEPLWLGINCSTGPGPMTEHVRALAAIAPRPVAVCPNAGLPDPEGRYLETPEEFSRAFERFAAEGWINLVGGCCGTGVGHVMALRAVADRHPPRTPAPAQPARLAGGEAVEIRQAPAPLLIGERTNALGSKKFRELTRAGRYAEAAEIGRRQVRGGAHVLDVCLADPEADEGELTEGTLLALRRAVRVPLVVDSTDPAVIARALELVPGRPVINSVNLEDGGAGLEEVARLARRFGAAVVAGCIDEHPSEGMARTAERKLEVAARLLARLEACGVPPADVLVDALVFPAASGDARFAGAAAETVRGVRLVKERFPEAQTLLGISNVSFGLPAAGREVLNAVFLHHCVQAGLDAAIVNTEQLVRFPTIPAEVVALAEAVLFEGSKAAIDAFAARFRAARTRAADDDAALPAEERLRRMVVDGRRSGLEVAIDELLGRMDPLAIINGPLLAGMDEVGRLFGAGQLIVAEVLVSAEVMQAAVDRLKPHMGGEDATTRGSLLLATVRGDVHDIGKSLVNIIFSSNGYRVVDLGVQCPSDRLVAAWQEHRTDLIGLSGLLVRSAHQMAATATDLSAAGISVPLLVGGAALSGAFTRAQIAPAYAGEVRYAPDAMAGLAMAKEVMSLGVGNDAGRPAAVPGDWGPGAGGRGPGPLPGGGPGGREHRPGGAARPASARTPDPGPRPETPGTGQRPGGAAPAPDPSSP
ncbi:MAG: homocysteine S-methyltransferase family protein [Thermoanaerobaculaceae bacterium]